MGDDIDFVRALLDTYKAGANETVKRMNLEELRDTLGDYDLSEEERTGIRKEIDKELETIGVSVVLSKKEVEIMEEEEEAKAMTLEAREKTREELESEHEAKLTEILAAFKTNPDGLAEAIDEGISPEMKKKLAELIRARLERKGLIEAIDWERNVAKYIDRCEKEGGIVMMRTRYSGERFEDRENPGKYLVLMICYSKRWSQWFGNCSLSDIEKLEMD